MISTISELETYFKSLRQGDYQRDNFDAFLEKIKFSFNLPAIHISGSNGKGTTGSVIKNIYIKEKYKVGYFHSPYLYNVTEMINVNDNNIDIKDFLEIVNQYRQLIDKYSLSEFEVETLVAFEFFKKEKVDIAIIECGMGGLLDATNIFTPILSIITSISLEHTFFLGSSLTEVARHKAGIIKRDIPVLVGELDDEAMEVIKEVAKENKSRVYVVGRYLFEELQNDGYMFTYKPYDNLKIHSLALFSVIDASIALAGVEILKERFPVSKASIYEGVANTSLTGRMEILNQKPLVIADGAHNPEASMRLRESIEKLQNDRPVHIIFAAFRDKNIERMLAEYNFISQDITLTTFDHPRARQEEEYFLFLGEFPFIFDYKSLIAKKFKEFPNDIIVITGSLAFSSIVSKEWKDGLIK